LRSYLAPASGRSSRNFPPRPAFSRYFLVTLSVAMMPTLAPASMDMLAMVKRSLWLSLVRAGPVNSRAM